MARVSDALRDEVRNRAEGRCEYCRIPDIARIFPFHVEHIIAIKHGGLTFSENLAWSCLRCNVSKGSDVASYDSETGALTPLYNPRTQDWNEHFEIDGPQIVGKTPVGRVTVRLLQLNTRQRIRVRVFLQRAGLW